MYAACSMIPVINTYSEKKIIAKLMILRQVLNLIAIEEIMIGIEYSGSVRLR